jgi:arginyl-tRNA synthetase
MLKFSIKTRLGALVRRKLGLKKVLGFELSEPPAHIKADLATNLPLILAKELKKPPQEIGRHLAVLAQEAFGPDLLEAGFEGGFLNLTFSPAFWQSVLKKILEQGKDFGRLQIGKNEKVLVEFVSNNPTGPLHLGNGRNAAVGEAVSRILENAGFKVSREYYVNNAKRSSQIQNLGLTVQGKSKEYAGKYLTNKIKELKRSGILTPEILKKEPGEVGHLVAQSIIKDVKVFLEKKFDIRFDKFFEEEELYAKGYLEKVKETLIRKKATYKKQGALWLKTSRVGDEKDRVLVRSDGNPGYFLPDIAYHQNKFDRGYSRLIDVLGADHQGHQKRMQAAARILDWPGRLDFIILQMVRLRTQKGVQKMSKRAGTLVYLEELVDEVGADVVKFILISRGADTQMIFDLELARRQSRENPVYYLQYAYARICSVFDKASRSGPEIFEREAHLELLSQEQEFKLIGKLAIFADLLSEIAQTYQVQHLAIYLMELAQLFHEYYERHRIVSDDEAQTAARLALLKAVQVVLKKGLNLLGISTPTQM